MATFNIGDRALFQRRSASHDYHDLQRRRRARLLRRHQRHGREVHRLRAGTRHATNLPAPARSALPGECRTIVQYDTRHARQATPAQQQQARTACFETVCVCPRYNFPHRRTVECEWLESDRAAGFAEPNGAVGGLSPSVRRTPSMPCTATSIRSAGARCEPLQLARHR